MQDDEEEEEEEAKEGATPKSDTEGDNSAPRQRHRVTTKGSNIPAHSETFEDLHDRFQLPSQLMSNLSNNGYLYPTAIQSYGIPILLEVTRLALIASEFLLMVAASLEIWLPSLQQVREKPFRISYPFSRPFEHQWRAQIQMQDLVSERSFLRLRGS